ncbi:hypothetical protein [Leucobacter denitrificans]|uniref:Uncharacterized protein n=1 Tax=Leucobacter denitrificans TaxID=683042 RepID=A0A7G9S5D9_9MICO|nr:hypothetical protein [Leucobacter denitrificans]QNN63064.1 hypothetical protein H9L06_01410 [Leucobacter denitrificans]
MQSVITEFGALVTDAGRTLLRFVVGAARALWMHWPQLIGLFLAGWIGRMGFLWLATVTSNWSPTVAVLILPLAPFCTLLSFVLMLRAMAPTLPAFSGMFVETTAKQRWRDDFAVAGKVLIPFLAVYASAGLLKQDAAVFLVDTTADESLNTAFQDIDWGRTNYAPGLAIVAFVLVALIARKVISMLGLVERNLAWAGLAAYIEILWVMTLVNVFNSQIESLTSWIATRRITAPVIDWWERTFEAIREWSALVGGAIDAVSAVLGNLGAVVVVPVAWLAIGAAVYGHQLRSVDLYVPGHEETTKRLQRIPNPVRRVAAQVTEPVVTPVRSAFSAIRKIAVAGVLPMVMFCIVFLISGAVQSGATLLLHEAFGPGPALRQFALEPFALLAERGVYFVLTLSLLAAAVNAVVMAQKESDRVLATQSVG